MIFHRNVRPKRTNDIHFQPMKSPRLIGAFLAASQIVSSIGCPTPTNPSEGFGNFEGIYVQAFEVTAFLLSLEGPHEIVLDSLLSRVTLDTGAASAVHGVDDTTVEPELCPLPPRALIRPVATHDGEQRAAR